jgi:hypothetical protein
MTDMEIKKQVTAVRAELDGYLADGSREAIMKSILLLQSLWDVLVTFDYTVSQTYLFQKIWMDEQAKGEESILADVRSVDDVKEKHRMIRHALFRLENDFPDDLCLEALQVLSELRLSSTAFQEMLSRCTEDSTAILTRISQLTQSSTADDTEA